MDDLLGSVDDLAASAGVTDRSVRLWFRTANDDIDGHRVRLSTTGGDTVCEAPLGHGLALGDHVRVLRIPGDVPGASRLAPLTRYRFELLQDPDAVPLVLGEFETAPPKGQLPGKPFSFAVMSCHQPLREDGQIAEDALHMLRALPDVFEREHVTRVLMVGDQMYTDLPEPYSLFNGDHFARVAPGGRRHILECTAAEVRALLQARYRRAWGIPAFDRVQRRWPVYQIPDDHEFVDNWGSHPDHAQPQWAAFAEGARTACHDYELSRHLDGCAPPFDHVMEYGSLATFVMDLRSMKYATADEIVMYHPKQLEALERFLSEHRSSPVVMIVFSVPLYHLPDWLGRLATRVLPEGGDAHDRWSAPRARESREAIVRLLKSHKRRNPEQLMLLLGGDVHVSLAAQLRWPELPGPIYQFTSSPLSNTEGALKQALAGLVGRLKSHVETGDAGGVRDMRLLDGQNGHDHNPVPELNTGIIRFEPRGELLEVKLKLYSFEQDDSGRGKLVFESNAIKAPLPAQLHERLERSLVADPRSGARR